MEQIDIVGVLEALENVCRAIEQGDENRYAIAVSEGRAAIRKAKGAKRIGCMEGNANLIEASSDLLEALEIAMWAEQHGEAEAQRQGKPRFTERLEIYAAAIHKAKGTDLKRVCCVCRRVYDDNGLTGETWDGVEEVTHGYCPKCYEEARGEK